MKPVALHGFLGWVAEQNSDVLFALGDYESRQLRSELNGLNVDRPIYVCGLARAGTTILLELLAETEGTASYRYMDFPMVMIPYWWGRFLAGHRKRASAAVERSHGDGLQVTPASPEAMEEILWMHFFPHIHDPGRINALSHDDRNDRFDSYYKNTLKKLVLSRNASRYVAKNNYNISRLDYLVSLFPDARFVIAVRDPHWHIASLVKQHRLLSAEEAKDSRILAYMRRCGHFEFGLDRRPLTLRSLATTHDIQELWSAGRVVEGWTRYWVEVHEYLCDVLENNEAVSRNVLVVSYEKLCEHPRQTLSAIYQHTGLHPASDLLDRQSARLRPPDYYKPSFNEQEEKIIRSATSDLHQRILRVAGSDMN